MYKKNLQNKKVGQIKFWRVNLEQIELLSTTRDTDSYTYFGKHAEVYW